MLTQVACDLGNYYTSGDARSRRHGGMATTELPDYDSSC